MTHSLPLPDFTHERVEVITGRRSGLFIAVALLAQIVAVAEAWVAEGIGWSATNALRLELEPRGIQVVGLHLGYTDTPMTAGVTAPKNDPADVVRTAYDGLEAGQHEVLADDTSRWVKATLAEEIASMYPQLAK
jgi:hypothetical protein